MIHRPRSCGTHSSFLYSLSSRRTRCGSLQLILSMANVSLYIRRSRRGINEDITLWIYSLRKRRTRDTQ